MSDDRALRIAEDAARAAGEVLVRRFRGRLDVRHKAEYDPVTDADVEAEEALLAVIRAAFPDHATLGEETGRSGDAEHVWIADPLDGTLTFIRGVPEFAVSVAVARLGQVIAGAVLDPIRGELFSARHGGPLLLNNQPLARTPRPQGAETLVAIELGRQRRADARSLDLIAAIRGSGWSVRIFGSTAMAMAYAAAGPADLSLAINPGPWDVAGGVALCRAAGLDVILRGGTVLDPLLEEAAAGTPEAVAALWKLIGR